MANIFLSQKTVNEFVEGMVKYIHSKKNADEINKENDPFYKAEEEIKKLREQNKEIQDVTIVCAIGILIVMSDLFDSSFNASNHPYLNQKEQDILKSGEKNKRDNLIFSDWINKWFNIKRTGYGGFNTYISAGSGEGSFVKFRTDFLQYQKEQKENQDIKMGCMQVEDFLDDFLLNYLKHLSDKSKDKKDTIDNNIKKMEEVYKKIMCSIQEEKTVPTPNTSYEGYKNQIKEALENGTKQIILTGAPGTGKTRMAKEIAEKLGAALSQTTENSNNTGDSEDQSIIKKYELVQFHPSYDYTDFIEGLRPVESEGNIVFKKIDGIFKNFCRKVAESNAPSEKEAEDARKEVEDETDTAIKAEKEKKAKEKEQAAKKEKEIKYFFIIDEINRADLSKVFGELMYCLESDKRGKTNKVQTQYQNLKQYDEKGEPIKDDVFKDGFYIPENVYIIGTMNDIDRSVESMDFALRRRFMWSEIEVNKELLIEAFGEMFKDNKNKTIDLADYVMKLNNVIYNYKDDKNKSIGQELSLNKQYYISQGQFAGLPENIKNKLSNDNDIDRFLKEVFKWRIEPLLREYVRGEEKAEKFIEACANAWEIKYPDNDESSGSDNEGQPTVEQTDSKTGESNNGENQK